MHYIIGTEVYVEPFATMNTQAMQPINAQRISKKVRSVGPFEPGVKYTLYNIRKVEEGFEYTFTMEGTNQTMWQNFYSIGAAEEMIAAARGEQVPNFDVFHTNRRD